LLCWCSALALAELMSRISALSDFTGAARTTLTEQAEIVDRHNELRHVQPTTSNLLKMGWNSEAVTCSMKHSPSSSRVTSTSGENLYMPSWTNAAQAWYDEVHDFRYGVGSINGDVVGLYTQVVWYGSNQISCAVTYCPNATYKWHYCPPGNYWLTHPYKSGPTCGECPDTDNNPCLYNDQYSNCPELQQQWGCSHSDVASWCPASCRRTNQII
uniref:ShKT domain-containing protein n=1 Tax=Poecilia formosa TaxID=48698 RepID=A0A087Y3E9_POEFO